MWRWELNGGWRLLCAALCCSWQHEVQAGRAGQAAPVATSPGGAAYEVHVFELYFEKDMSSCPIGVKFQGHNCRGHRHDIESVIMYFKNGVPVPVGASAQGGYKMKAWAHVPKQYSMQGTHTRGSSISRTM